MWQRKRKVEEGRRAVFRRGMWSRIVFLKLPSFILRRRERNYILLLYYYYYTMYIHAYRRLLVRLARLGTATKRMSSTGFNRGAPGMDRQVALKAAKLRTV